MMSDNLEIWIICALATAGVITRPFRVPEWIWALGGAALLLVFGLISPSSAITAVWKGADVYLFLTGMMLLSEVARANGVFDWVATLAVNHANGSRIRLFTLIYGAGVIVTTFMSNDATAVVLTPAVFAAAKKAEADALPMLFACALIANAASFVLPVSNPANLVLYGGTPPALAGWLAAFALPSLLSIAGTYIVLRLFNRSTLASSCKADVDHEPLSTGGKAALAGIVGTAVLLVTCSAFHWSLGLPTAIAGAVTTALVCALGRQSPFRLIGEISWGVLPLVAGLFVLVSAIDKSGLIAQIAAMLHDLAQDSSALGKTLPGVVLAFVSNILNNLPAGLIASEAVAQAHVSGMMVDNLLIGVDLGPNLSVTGSLATILWLQVIRREGEDVGFFQFLKVGAVAMPVTLVMAIGARLLMG